MLQIHRFGTVGFLLALILSLFSPRPAHADDPARFLTVESWDASFTIEIDEEAERNNGSYKLHLRADTTGPLDLLQPGSGQAGWTGAAKTNGGSVQEMINIPGFRRTATGSIVHPGQFQLIGAVAMDLAKGTYSLVAFQPTYIDAQVEEQYGGGAVNRRTQTYMTSLLANAENQILPTDGLTITGSKVLTGLHYSDHFINTTYTLRWRLIPRNATPSIRIEQIFTPAFEEGKHTFLSTDSLAIRARISGVGSAPSQVRWTVTGREAAALNGFPRNEVEPVTGGVSTFSFRPANNRRLVNDRRNNWAKAGRAPNPPLAFEVLAELLVGGQVKGTARVTAEELQQDEKDILRQEYSDFTLVSRQVVVPPRTEVGEPTSTSYFAGSKFNTGNYVSPAVVRNGAMQALAQTTQSAYGSGVQINSAFRNPRRNKAVKGRPNSRHMFGDAADLEPTGEAGMTRVDRRREYLKLYRAALGAGADRVLLERGADQLVPANFVIPAPTAQQPDRDGDGIPDRLRIRFRGSNERAQVLFDRASHVHLEKVPD